MHAIHHMTFQQWTDGISARVRVAVPGVLVKRKIDDVCRLVYGPKECQLHAVSENAATFVTLRRDTFGLRPSCRRLTIEAGSEDQIAVQIIGWFKQESDKTGLLSR
jgi:hypothetical protein